MTTPGIGDLPPGRPLQSQFDDGRDYPRLGTVSFRRGTLTDAQQRVWNEHFPRCGRVLADERLDLDSWFGRARHPTIVEIGSGTGTSTVSMAAHDPDTNVVAVELYKPGLAKMLTRMLREGVDNIRMVRGDAIEVLNRMIAPGSLAGIRIFFPDPWPKARHHKRRIIQSGPLHLFATRLAPGGALHVATDHAGYAEWIEELADAEPLLAYKGGAWPDCPIATNRQGLTKFEHRGIGLDHVIREFFWRRVSAE